MKFLKQGVCLALLAGVAAVPAWQATAQSSAPAADDSLVTQIRDQADGAVTFSSEKATGRITFVRAASGGDLHPEASTSGTAKATAYVEKYATAFGATAGQLAQDSVSKNEYGTTVTYTQSYKGIPVWGTLVRAHLDAQGDLTAVNGEAVPISGLSTETSFSADEAGKRAVRAVKANPGTHGHTESDGHETDTSGLKAKDTKLVVYRQGLLKGQTSGKLDLAYEVEVTNARNIRDMVFVSATTGKLINRYSLVHNALDRELYETSPNTTPVWKEGDALPGTLNADQESMVRSTGDSYWLFKNVFGRDSYDGSGAKMKTVNNDPTISCPNANWNGVTTNYCDGVSSDDVVAHEWGHAYTEYTSGLIYQYQSGALNEAYSDIWGETVDLLNRRLDEGEGDLKVKRPVGQCSKYTRGGIGATINSPASVAGPCAAAAAASFGPVFDKAGTTSDMLVAADEANPAGPTTTDGCTAYTNAADIAGKWAYVDRGTCAFTVKIANAKAAGATGIVFGDNAPNRPPGSVAGVSDIYGLMVTQADGTKIKSAGGVLNITVKDTDTAPKADSYRWLMGEKSAAFGGAIRDMWNPNCYGDPGKVSDAQYVCGTEDGGGVHSNSGVPNHGYALLVDGGTFNNVSVPAIGFDKAAAIYFRAQTDYQTPASNFADHADALAASCADLTGKQIRELSTEPNDYRPSKEKITAADCAAVGQMAKAVELRLDPTDKCNYQPLLKPGAPALCGPNTVEDVVYSEDFETKGLGDWTLDGNNPFGGPLRDWETDADMPGTNNTIGAYGPAKDMGRCDGSTSDFSSVNTMTSKDIVIPADGTGPRLSFRHYVATELGFDGGNVQLSVNGGAFAPIAKAAYTFNPPTDLASEADGNTSPLAGQPGFNGTDGGKVTGSWGESQVDLAAAGVAPGSTIKLQFAIGRDGCGGNDGWYVDDIKVAVCEAAATVTATHVPNPSRYGTASKLNVKVVGGGTDTPSGTVAVKRGSSTLGTVTLSATGTGSLTLSKTLPVGSNTLTLNYSGDTNYDPSTGTAKATVAKATSKTTASARPTSVKRGTKFVATVKVTATGVTPTGSVKIYKGTRLLATGKLVGGTVKVNVGTSVLSVGTHKLAVKYSGSTTVGMSQGTVTIKVTR